MNRPHKLNKHKSSWRAIKVVHSNETPIVFDLDEKVKLKKKLSRQTIRDLSKELMKLQDKSITPIQSQFTSPITNTKAFLSIQHQQPPPNLNPDLYSVNQECIQTEQIPNTDKSEYSMLFSFDLLPMNDYEYDSNDDLDFMF